MGRAKKIVSTPTGAPVAPAPVALKVQLRAQLQTVQAEIQRIHLEDSPERVQVALRLAGLQVRAWDLEGLLTSDVNVRLACARKSASWAEQQIRAAKAMSVDLLRDLFTKAEQMERHSSNLKDLK
jgi:hypothetical protein